MSSPVLQSTSRARNLDLLFSGVLVGAVALLFIGAPHGGAFYVSDSPRHALNGVFVADFLRDMPFRDPAAYAYAYYAKYPALTILFYPPLFYLFSAPFYWLFGVSQEAGLAAVFVLYCTFATGSYRLFRFWLPASTAACAAAGLALSPEIAFWGRQVMLEIPAFAPLVWSAVCFTAFRRTGRTLQLYLAALLLVLTMYTKISAGFMALVYLLTLVSEHRALFRQRHVWIVGILSVIALVPLIFLTVKFGQANLQSVSGIADAEVSRRSLNGWLWYLKQIPAQLGWPLSVAALLAISAGCLWRTQNVLGRNDLVFWGAWFVIGYLFFSAVDLKEARHSVFILPPLVFVAYRFIATRAPQRAVLLIASLLSITTAMQTVLSRPVLFVDGYAQAARFIAAHAPKGSAVVFSGYRDGSFIFNMRMLNDVPDLSVVRADKLLLRVAVRRELGIEQKQITESEIADTLNSLGVHYVVAQPGFWTDLESMRRLERILASNQFERVARLPTPANYSAHEKELVIYRNVGNPVERARRIDIELPMIGRSVTTPKPGE